MYSVARTEARPPQMLRRPRHWPLSRLNGARPTNAAICRRSNWPSSGNSASSVRATTGPTRHAAQQVLAHAPHRTGFDGGGDLAVDILDPALEPANMLPEIALHRPHRGLSKALALGGEHLQQLAAPSDQGRQAWVAASGKGRTTGCTRAPNSASTCASIASVFAVRPSACAKARTCRGFTTATGNPLAAHAATTGPSYPPVASITITVGRICTTRVTTTSSALGVVGLTRSRRSDARRSRLRPCSHQSRYSASRPWPCSVSSAGPTLCECGRAVRTTVRARR